MECELAFWNWNWYFWGVIGIGIWNRCVSGIGIAMM